MDATPHLVVGVALGMRLRSPFLAFALGLASHAALDLTPHSNYTGWRPVSSALVADVVVGTAATLAATRLAPRPASALAGAAGAAFPDLERVVGGHSKDLFQRPPLGFSQKEIPPPWGVLTQAGVLGLAAFFVWRWRRRG